MIVWLRIVRGVLTDPLTTFRGVADQHTWREGVVFYWLTSLLVWAIGLLHARPRQSFSDKTDPILSSPWFSLLLSASGPLLVLFFAAILYWAGRYQSGTGSLARLFTTELFNGAVVSLVSAPILLVIYLIMRVTGGLNFLGDIESFGVTIWGIGLSYFSVRASMGLSKRGAINALLIMFGTIFVVAIMLLCIGMFVFLGTRR